MPATGLDHRGIRTADLEASRHFYADLLGLEVGERPAALPTQGYWLYAGADPIIHLVQDSDGSVDPNVTPRSDLAGSGGHTHIALTFAGARAVVERLRAENVTYWDRLIREPLMYQVFVEDPNGLLIELIDRTPGEIDGPIRDVVG
ncbi:MAG: VOC family protein [Alphaproteobacteria bacterium]|jgi:catechol 2,3-dioxygenase-like lactoylglutathione lyase family enzyme